MENLLTIQPNTVLQHTGDSIDLEDFLKDSLEPLLKKVKYRLSQLENAVVNSEKATLAYQLLENLSQQWNEQCQISLETKRHQILQELDIKLIDKSKYYHIMTPPELVSAILELYQDLDNNSDDTIDSFMMKMEALDNKISDALSTAEKMLTGLEIRLKQVADAANEKIDKLKYAMSYGKKGLLVYDELPGPWQSNQYIKTGYRFLNSAADCWISLFYIHNETGNIWTHLLGFVALFTIGFYQLFFSELMTSIPIKDRLVFLVFFLAACKCLMCSTVWHTLSGINDLKLYRQVACLDYVGISVLICASIILCEYYGFYCHDAVRNTYITATSTLAIIGVSMPFQSWFDKHERRWLRIAFFVALASSGAIVIMHLSYLHGTYETFNWLSPVFKSLLCYIIGVLVYGNQFPEKFWPGKFDRLGHSHQFWHLLVCGGIWYHYQAALSFAANRQVIGQCPL